MSHVVCLGLSRRIAMRRNIPREKQIPVLLLHPGANKKNSLCPFFFVVLDIPKHSGSPYRQGGANTTILPAILDKHILSIYTDV